MARPASFMSAKPHAHRVHLSAAGWLVLGGLAEAGYLLWAHPRSTPPAYGTRLALYLFLFLPALAGAALTRRRPAQGAGLWWALGLALLFRLTLLPSTPDLSDDIYRYLWDGWVQVHGINPYRYAPSDPALAALRDPLYPPINHPDLPTTYPPLCELLFAAVAFVSRTVVAMKAVMTLAEIGTWYLVVRIWALRGLSLARLLLYLWNPLVILEVSGSGHNDIVGVGLLLYSGLLIILGRPGVSIAALGSSVAAKYFPVIVLPAWLRGSPKRLWAVVPLVWLLLWGPYLKAGSRLFTGLAAYARHWEANAFLFRWLREGVAWLDPKPLLDREWGELCAALGRPDWAAAIWPYTEPRQIAKALVAAGLAICLLAWIRRRAAEPTWIAFRMLGLVLLWAPTLHPWYLLWVLPFAAWYASPSWLLFSATVFLSYAPPGWGALPHDALLWAEYAPFLAAWAWEELRRRRLEAAAGP